MTGRAESDRGSVSIEMAIIMPAFLIAFVLLITFAGRLSQAENVVRSSAQEAARAATLTSDAGYAVEVGQRVANANLATSGVNCVGGAQVAIAADLAPGGSVTATITCQVSFGDLSRLGVPGARTIRAQAVEVVDIYRSAGGAASAPAAPGQ